MINQFLKKHFVCFSLYSFKLCVYTHLCSFSFLDGLIYGFHLFILVTWNFVDESFVIGIKSSKLPDFSIAMNSAIVVFSWPTGIMYNVGSIYLVTAISLGKIDYFIFY